MRGRQNGLLAVMAIVVLLAPSALPAGALRGAGFYEANRAFLLERAQDANVIVNDGLLSVFDRAAAFTARADLVHILASSETGGAPPQTELVGEIWHICIEGFISLCPGITEVFPTWQECGPIDFENHATLWTPSSFLAAIPFGDHIVWGLKSLAPPVRGIHPFSTFYGSGCLVVNEPFFKLYAGNGILLW